MTSPFRATYNALEKYGFRDELGHPLENCVEYQDNVKALEAARDLFAWYYIFGEDSSAAREHLARLGNALAKVARSWRRRGR